MPTRVDVIDKMVGITAEEAQDRIANGWSCLPGISLAKPNAGIVKPGDDQMGPPFQLVDLWISPRADLVPVNYIAESIFKLAQRLAAGGEGREVLDVLSRSFFNLSLQDLMDMVGNKAKEAIIEEEVIDGSE